MATVWITFATEDNVDGNVDYLAQEISRCGWKTRMHPMFPGEDDKIDRLMPAFLAKPQQSDAWILYGSGRAMDDGRAARLEGAIQKAIAMRGSFTAVGLFPAGPDRRGFHLTHSIGLHDADWREQLGKALGCDLTEQSGGALPSYIANVKVLSGTDYGYSFECRPRLGRWDAFVFAVPPEDRDRVAPMIPGESVEEGFSDDAEWYFQIARRRATAAEGYSVLMRELPSRLAFGQEGLDEAVILELRPKN